jgi:hypothetical protein
MATPLARASAAVVIGAIVLVGGAVGYTVEAFDKLA